MRGVTAGLVLLMSPAMAEPLALTGTIGGKPIFAELNRNGDTVSGWYYYLKAGKQLRLDGQLSAKGVFNIDEHTPATNARSGGFSGSVSNGHWSGVWKNGRTKLPVALDPVKGPLAGADGHYRCVAKRNDESFGIKLRHSLDLTLSGGKVKGLKLERSTTGDGDEQSCSLRLSDLSPMAAPVGAALRARSDSRNAPQHCTLRILQAGDFLIIRPGQPSQAGDDCRGAGDAHFCSPRAFWSDLVVNKKTQSCKSVE